MSFPQPAISALSVVAMVVTSSQLVRGGDWLTLPSSFTHDPATGARIDQYANNQPSVSNVDPSFRRSGYRQYRSTLQYGQAADNYHTVEKWGDPVRPYGEWRFPVRPYSAPYPAWGAPLAGFNAGGLFPGWPPGYQAGGPGGRPNFGHGGFGNQAIPHGGGSPFPDHGGASLTPYPPLPSAGYPAPPYYDGAYPTYGEQPRLNDRQFFFKPTQ